MALAEIPPEGSPDEAVPEHDETRELLRGILFELREQTDELRGVNARMERLEALFKGMGAHPVLSRLFGPAPKR
jgi:hypothetical protein